MAKIRITNKDKKEYKKLKEKVQRKIRDKKKKFGVDLSNEIKIPSLSEFSTRKQYNEWKQKASSFTNRNNTKYQFRKNEKGMVYTIAELNAAKKANRIEREIAKRKQKEYAKKPFMRHGQQIGTAGDRFGMLKRPKNIGFSIPPKFDINNYYTRYDFNRRKEAMERRAQPGEFDRRLENFKEVFLGGLEQMYNGDEETYKVIQKLNQLNPDQLYDLYLENDEFQALFNPSPDKGVNGVQVVDEQEHRDTLFEIEKIVDKELSGKQSPLRSFPNNW